MTGRKSKLDLAKDFGVNVRTANSMWNKRIKYLNARTMQQLIKYLKKIKTEKKEGKEDK